MAPQETTGKKDLSTLAKVQKFLIPLPKKRVPTLRVLNGKIIDRFYWNKMEYTF